MGLAMRSFHINRLAREHSVETSLDAALEIEQVIQGKLQDTPSLKKLVDMMLGTSDEGSVTRKDLLGNPQVANLYRRASGSSEDAQAVQIDRILTLFGNIYSVGVAKFEKSDLEFIRDFCLGVNRQLINESYSKLPSPTVRKERVAINGQRAWA
jgi:hypothetical protein